MQPQTTLKRKARHVDEFSVTDCFRSHHFENSRWQTLAKISTWHFFFSEKFKFINMTSWHESLNSYLATFFCAENIGYRSRATFHERAYCRPILECFMDEFVQNLSSATKSWSHVYCIIRITHTVRVLLYDLFNFDFTLANLTDILQGYLTGAGESSLLLQCQWVLLCFGTSRLYRYSSRLPHWPWNTLISPMPGEQPWKIHYG